jgi:hypothetical protein
MLLRPEYYVPWITSCVPAQAPAPLATLVWQTSRVRAGTGPQAPGTSHHRRTLVDFAERTAGGRALALIDVTDDISGYQIPLGAAAQVAIYTEHWHHVSMIRKILLRMRSWQNYIFLEGH